MQEPIAAGTGGQPTDAQGVAPEELTPEQMIQQMIDARGGMPAPAEDDPPTEREQAMIEKVFQMETKDMMRDMEKAVKSKIPDASDTQAFNIAKAMMTQDLGDLIDAVIAAQQRSQEIDEKSQEQKELHVEGGASGKNSDEGKNLGLSGVFEKMANLYNKPI